MIGFEFLIFISLHCPPLPSTLSEVPTYIITSSLYGINKVRTAVKYWKIDRDLSPSTFHNLSEDQGFPGGVISSQCAGLSSARVRSDQSRGLTGPGKSVLRPGGSSQVTEAGRRPDLAQVVATPHPSPAPPPTRHQKIEI